MTYKHKMHAVDSNGKIVSSADFDFYINDVMSILLSVAKISFLHPLIWPGFFFL